MKKLILTLTILLASTICYAKSIQLIIDDGTLKRTVTYEDTIYSRTLDGVVYQHGYQDVTHTGESFEPVPNPESKAEAFIKYFNTWMQASVASKEANITSKAAIENTVNDVKLKIVPKSTTTAVEPK